MKNNLKTAYEHPEVNVIKFDTSSLITTSYSFNEAGYGDEIYWG